MRATIVQLLSNMSGTKEARFYLNRFTGVEATRFAVIKIGGAIIDDALEETASALACLHQVGLTPVVIHGGGPQLDQAIAQAGLTNEKRDGLRITTPEVLDVARQVFLSQNLKLVEAVRAQGVEAHTLNAGVIKANYLNQEKYGFVGKATGIQQDLIGSVIRSGAMPILTCLGMVPGGQLVNINGDAVVAALVHALQPMKIVFLSGTGGLLDADGNIINTINLTTDYKDLMVAPWIHSGMRLKLQEISKLLNDLPPQSSISITRPEKLIRELLTHSGAGTYIRRGEKLNLYKAKSEIDLSALQELLEGSFARALKPNWWDDLTLNHAIISENYRSAAIFSKIAGTDIPYLDKFAVATAARGEGLAKSTWQKMRDEVPIFFLRSRSDNPFNNFYQSQVDGFVRKGPWTIFWNGDVDLVKLAPQIDIIAKLPESFTPPQS